MNVSEIEKLADGNPEDRVMSGIADCLRSAADRIDPAKEAA